MTPIRLEPCTYDDACQILKERYMTYKSAQKFYGVGYQKAGKIIKAYCKSAKAEYGWQDSFRLPIEYFIELANIDRNYYRLEKKNEQ